MSSRHNLAVRGYKLLIAGATLLQPLVLLGIRLYWGWQFFLTGRGKLLHLDRSVAFFTGLQIPYPKFNAILASSTECTCGLLLLGSRLAAIPLIFTLCVAYATAEHAALMSIWSNSDKFVSAAPFEFLLACIIILAFGPGPISIDGLIKHLRGGDKSPTTAKP